MCTACIDLWKKELKANIRTKTSPCWKNADMTNWDTSAWEVAKVYMTHGQLLVTSAAETDVVGLMQLVHTCDWFTSFVKHMKSFEIVSIHVLMKRCDCPDSVILLFRHLCKREMVKCGTLTCVL